MSDKLKELDEGFRNTIENLLTRCRIQDVSMVPYFSLRTPYEQARLWRQSRPLGTIKAAIEKLNSNGAGYLAQVLDSVGPQNGPHVTNALPGASWHQWGLALDCYWEVNGGAEWSTTKKINGQNGYRVYANTAKGLGLTAGGFWNSLKDWPHVQKPAAGSPLKQGLSWSEIDMEMRKRFDPNHRAPAIETAFIANSNFKIGYVSTDGWRTYYTDDTPAVLFRSRMTVCADGATKAYHENNSKALDYLGNAGRPGNWWAIVTDDGTPAGNPVTQGKDDPAPGYYVSTTAMNNAGFDIRNPLRYVDATSIPYVVLPGPSLYRKFYPDSGPRLGDLGMAYNHETGLISAAIFAETGPSDEIGEGSIMLAKRLGLNSDPKSGGTNKKVVSYIVFPMSGSGTVPPPAEIDRRAGDLFKAWGGLARLMELFQD